MRKLTIFSVTTTMVAAILPAPGAAAPIEQLRAGICGENRRVSLSASGLEANGSSHDPHITADGGKVVFVSEATNLVPADTNGYADVFLKDLHSGSLERVSVGSAGVQANGHSGLRDPWWSYDGATAISSDGGVVAFTSEATNLVPSDTNDAQDVFLRGPGGEIELVSRNLAGVSANGHSRLEAVSGNGRFVLFESSASDLVPNSGPWRRHFYRFDRLASHILRVSVNSSGVAQNSSSFGGADISDDGSIVVFGTQASNLVSEDDNGTYDVFVRDIPSGITFLISESIEGGVGNGGSGGPEIAGNGLIVSFQSGATNLVPGFTPPRGQIYVRDLVSSLTRPVSVNDRGEPGEFDSWPASISPDGRYVSFSSRSQNLVDIDLSNHTEDIFLRDTLQETTELETVNALGLPDDGSSDGTPNWYTPYYGQSSLSSGGRFLAWAAWYSGTVAGDLNRVRDVFVRDRLARC